MVECHTTLLHKIAFELHARVWTGNGEGASMEPISTTAYIEQIQQTKGNEYDLKVRS
jgi:hypothetical protein